MTKKIVSVAPVSSTAQGDVSTENTPPSAKPLLAETRDTIQALKPTKASGGFYQWVCEVFSSFLAWIKNLFHSEPEPKNVIKNAFGRYEGVTGIEGKVRGNITPQNEKEFALVKINFTDKKEKTKQGEEEQLGPYQALFASVPGLSALPEWRCNMIARCCLPTYPCTTGQRLIGPLNDITQQLEDCLGGEFVLPSNCSPQEVNVLREADGTVSIGLSSSWVFQQSAADPRPFLIKVIGEVSKQDSEEKFSINVSFVITPPQGELNEYEKGKLGRITSALAEKFGAEAIIQGEQAGQADRKEDPNQVN